MQGLLKTSGKFLLALLMGLSAASCLGAETQPGKVIYYDYTRQDYLIKNPEGLIKYFVDRGFIQKNSAELKEFMEAGLKDKAGDSVVVMAMGSAPSEIVEKPDDSCTLRKYLNAGGKVVWLGGMPLFMVTSPDGFREMDNQEMEKVLDVRPAPAGFGKRAEITDAGRLWGMQEPDDDAYAAAKDGVDVVFSRVGAKACSWLKRFAPKNPFNGFIRYRSEYDGAKEAWNADVYRLALFSGKEVAVPAPEKRIAVDIGLKRHGFIRGEVVAVPVRLENPFETGSACSLSWALKDGKRVLKTGRVPVAISPGEKKDARIDLDTSAFVSKGYELEIAVWDKKEPLSHPARTGIYIARPYDSTFPFGVTADGSLGRNSLIDMQTHNITHVSPHGTASVGFMDRLLRYQLKLVPIGDVYYNTALAESHPETRMKLSNGEEIGVITRRELCFNHPLVQEQAIRRLKEQLNAVKDHPAFSKYFFFDDDTFLYYNHKGHISCYCATCADKFRKKTGLEPPKSAAWDKYGNGVIPEDDPWLLWQKFRCFDNYGNYHRILEEEKNRIAPLVKMGPLPGLAQFPFFHLQSGLYPPSGLGPLSLLSSYFYPSLFRPLKDCVYHGDLAFMGNRAKELWIMPQAHGRAYIVPKAGGTILKGQGEGTGMDAAPGWFIRNQFYSWLAGGARGIIYFYYPALVGPYGQEGYEEIKRLGAIAEKYGPLFVKLERTPKEVGVWVSFINGNCFDLPSGGAYRELLEAHVPAETVCDEEIEGGRLPSYKVLVLEGIHHLTEKMRGRIEKYIKQGGVVVQD
ncbi:MAG: beta-galactosidase, partial [Kiritimatiellia bacterium]|nr:beta-galactosidase [Kiritimatiellia bacterium]